VARSARDHRLQYAVTANRLRHAIELLGVEYAPRLIRVRHDRIERDPRLSSRGFGRS
jgi:hypothetical protein